MDMDNEGILWISDVKGLYRFNGHTAININRYINDKQANVITDEWLKNFVRDDEDNIWIGSSSGLYKIRHKDYYTEKINLDTPKFEANFRNIVSAVKAHNDTLYVGTFNGLYILDTPTGEIIDIVMNDGEFSGDRQTTKCVYSIYPDISHSHIWIVMFDGIYSYQKSNKKIEKWVDRNDFPVSLTFYDGFLNDSLLIMPTWRYGIVTFNINTKEVSNKEIDRPEDMNYTNVRSMVPLDDEKVLISVTALGTGVYDLKSQEPHWLPVHKYLKEGYHKVFMDFLGYIWSGRRGFLFRSKKPVVNKPSKFESIIDVTDVYGNDRRISRPCLDGYTTIECEENQKNIDVVFSYPLAHIYDTVSYEYRTDGKEWKAIVEPNKLSLYNLDGGNHHLVIRATSDGKILASRDMKINIFLPVYKRMPFILGSSFILGFLIFFFYRKRVQQIRKMEKLKADYDKKLIELEVKALRSQMNPHFIFNTLNSLKYYAVSKRPEETSAFITQFSDLIRAILEKSNKNLITLGEEIDILENYMSIENLRFNNGFIFEIEVDSQLSKDSFLLPPMIIQPFVENAIWHGLMHKEGEKILKLRFLRVQKGLKCVIEDNGIGRKIANNLTKQRTHKTSMGMNITQERIKHLNKYLNLNNSFELIDLEDDNYNPLGTKVIIYFTDASTMDE